MILDLISWLIFLKIKIWGSACKSAQKGAEPSGLARQISTLREWKREREKKGEKKRRRKKKGKKT